MSSNFANGENKIVFVTGASRGLGLEIAHLLTAHGYDVVPLSKSQGCDVADYESVRSHTQPYVGEPRVWGLVNCAGIGHMGLTVTQHQSRIENMIAVNFLGTINTNKCVGALLARRRQGRIINFSSIAATMAIKGEAVYSATKAGVECFTRAFAREMAPFRVTVNCVAPGPVDTDMTRGINREVLARVTDHQAFQRMATPMEVADAVLLLLDANARMVTGDVLHVGGA